MCGIAGLLGMTFASDQIDQILRRMQTALKHRGPDDRGTYVSLDRQAALAHTRLSILDLSPAGQQPMSSSDGRYWITFNGEIYNFRQLRSQLEAQGEQFQSQTDTEVILKLYQRWGQLCLNHLRGMFAFAIWDDWEKTCFLARDPLGIKPLYYWKNGATLAFASEVSALLASGLPSVDLSLAGLYGYLISGSVPEPHTLIQGIHCLQAGHWLHWQAGNLNLAQYWKIQFEPQPIAPVEAEAKVRAALVDSIQHHLVSDVPVGLFLSGGIDSCVILALAHQAQSQPIRTYSIGFEEPAWNEANLAQQVAQQFGSDHREYTLTAAIGRSLLPGFLDSLDQPTIDGFNTFCVARLAHGDGTKVVMSGLGGDELFGGYRSFQHVPRLVQWGQHLQRLPPLKAGLGLGLSWSQSAKIRRVGDFLQQPPTIEAAYRSFRGIFSHREACAIVRQYLPDQPLPDRPPPLAVMDHSSADEISHLEISRYLRNQLLRDSDVMSMAWGLELRVPLLDRDLLEAIAPIPSPLRLAAGKRLLTQAVPELPQWIVNRPKQGFSFPFDRWLGQEWGDLVGEVNCPAHIPLKPWSRRWSLMVLNHWWQRVSA